MKIDFSKELNYQDLLAQKIEVSHYDCERLNPHLSAVQKQEWVYAEVFGEFDKNKVSHVENMAACA